LTITEAAWFQEPAIVRPQAEGEQSQAQGTITVRRPSTGQHADGEDPSIIYY